MDLQEHACPASVATSTVAQQPQYPVFVPRTDAGKRRWDLSMAVAARTLGDETSAGEVRTMAIWLFENPDITTD